MRAQKRENQRTFDYVKEQKISGYLKPPDFLSQPAVYEVLNWLRYSEPISECRGL